MSFHKNVSAENNFILRSIEELVPENHLVRKLEASMNWDFIYEEVKDKYSNTGRNCIDPVVLFKMIFINYMFGYNSMRKTCREIEVNVAYRWYLGISFEEKVPNYSTWSQNYIRRYSESELFEKIFCRVLQQAINKGYVKLETIYGDSTHQKACANKRKAHDETVELVKKAYEEDLLKEINEERCANNKKPFKTLKGVEIDFDDDGNEIEIRGKKDIKVSNTDPEAGYYHKGEHEECFAYSHQTFCDKNGFVIESVTVPGNVHDSTSFFNAYKKVNEKYPAEIKNVCLDAGYNTSAICREIIQNSQTPILPYKRPMGKKTIISKRKFNYRKEEDLYVCPCGVVLNYVNTTKEGYRIYKSNNCDSCPFKEKCTKMESKQLTRHVWERYKEDAEQLRFTDKWKKIYPQRKQTIERVFADDKENHCLRFTRLRGIKKNQHQALMIFTMHNLKKMALWDSNYGS